MRSLLRILPVTPSRILVTMLLSCSAIMAQAAPPIAGPDTRTVPLNRPYTINVLQNDSDPESNALPVVIAVAQPSNGVTRINQDNGIEYIPNTGFVGTDAFQYTIVGADDETATGQVTVTVTDRFIESVARTLKERAVATALDEVCNVIEGGETEALSAAQAFLVDRCAFLLDAGVDGGLEDALSAIAPEETLALMKSSARGSQVQAGAVSDRLAALNGRVNANSFVLNRRDILGGGAGDSLQAPWGVFASVMLDTTDKDETSNENGFDSDGRGITFGADYALRSNLYIGTALGLTTNDLSYVNNGGNMDSTVTTLFSYITWQRESLAVDAHIGFGSSDYDVTRHINYVETTTSNVVNATAIGKTSGTQLLFTGQLQYSWDRRALNLSPYVRLEYSRNTIKGYGENVTVATGTNLGAAGLAMQLGKQSTDTLQLNTGLQGQYVFNQSWGVLIPNFDISLIGELSASQDDVSGQFIFAPQGTGGYSITPEDLDSLFYRLSVGVNAVLPGGSSGFINVQQMLGYDDLKSTQLQAGFRYEI